MIQAWIRQLCSVRGLVSLQPILTIINAFEISLRVFSKGSENSGAKCPGCGCLWEQFQENGLLGCDICYQFFEEDLKIVLRRIHGSNQHIGSRPKSCRYLVDESELANIRVDLKRAINSENFERAAELRDMLRDANRETDKKDAAILR